MAKIKINDIFTLNVLLCLLLGFLFLSQFLTFCTFLEYVDFEQKADVNNVASVGIGLLSSFIIFAYFIISFHLIWKKNDKMSQDLIHQNKTFIRELNEIYEGQNPNFKSVVDIYLANLQPSKPEHWN